MRRIYREVMTSIFFHNRQLQKLFHTLTVKNWSHIADSAPSGGGVCVDIGHVSPRAVMTLKPENTMQLWSHLRHHYFGIRRNLFFSLAVKMDDWFGDDLNIGRIEEKDWKLKKGKENNYLVWYFFVYVKKMNNVNKGH